MSDSAPEAKQSMFSKDSLQICCLTTFGNTQERTCSCIKKMTVWLSISWYEIVPFLKPESELKGADKLLHYYDEPTESLLRFCDLLLGSL